MLPPKNNRPTLRLIARKTGLSLAATSMALRDHPRISRKTRDRVQAVAKSLGYHPDPKLATLMQHLRIQKSVEYRETLAFLNNYAPSHDWKWQPQYDCFYLGAAERALELGYRLDIFHTAEPDVTPAQISRQLAARGIRGLLVGGFKTANSSLAMNWSQFAAVTFDYSLASPNLHRATTNYHVEMLSVLHHLESKGCRRIGLVAKSDDDEKTLGIWHSAYLLQQERLPKAAQIPINRITPSKAAFETWLKRFRPDAIISGGLCDFPQDYERLYKKTAPNDIRYANLNISYADERSHGIDKLGSLVGRLACEHLIAQLQRNEIGPPSHPQVLSVEGLWVDDYTTWKLSQERWRQALVLKLGPELVAPRRR